MMARGELERLVAERAANRCEYCRMHQSLQGATFHMEHIVPKSRGGGEELDNLAWACPGCNLRKSDRIEAVDPQSGAASPLYHPRRDLWSAHMNWVDYQIVGISACGRATIGALELNHDRRILIRQAEQTFGLFPPQS